METKLKRRVADNRKQLKTQTPDGRVSQRDDATPRNVDVEHAHRVPDENWELGVEWERVDSDAQRRRVNGRSKAR